MKAFSFFLLFLLLFAKAPAQHTGNLHEQYRLKSLTIDNGLSNNRVRTMTQDKYGYLWMGTRKGISRYDGHAFKQYLDFIVNDTLTENMAESRESLYDVFGNLWFGGFYGLLRYDQQKDRFVRIILTDDDQIRNCLGVVQDPDSTVWFSFEDRIINYNVKTGTKKEYVYNPDDPLHTPGSSAMERLTIDSNGNLWITTRGNGVIVFNKKSETFIYYVAGDQPGALGENMVEKVYEEPNGTIWVSHRNNGISKFEPSTKTFKIYFPDPEARQSGRVRGLLRDSHGNFWVGTQNGVYLFDTENETFLHYAHMGHPKSRLSHNSIYFFFLDSHQNLWMGTHAGGVCYTNLNTSGFVKYEYSPISNNYFLNDNNVYALAVDARNNIWIGTGSGGLNYIQRRTGKFSYYTNDVNNTNSLLSNDVKAIVALGNNVWVGTYGGGVSFFDSNSQRFYNYPADNSNPAKLHSGNVFSLGLDPAFDDRLWIGTEIGLSMFDMTKKIFTQVVPGALPGINVPAGIERQKVNRIAIIDENRIAFAMAGVYILDYTSQSIVPITNVNGHNLPTILFVHVDKKGYLWFASDQNRLYRMDLQNNTFHEFDAQKGLPDVEMYGALDDNEGNLWVSSNNGLFRFTQLVNNQDTLIVERFDGYDNLQSVEFNFGAFTEGHNNELFFGGINGFNSFFAHNIKSNPFKPFVHITNVAVENKKVSVGQQVFGGVMLENDILNTRELEIYHKAKSFTFTFNALHYSAPESNMLAYKMEGYDEDWTYIKGSEGTATYTIIPPGTYTFKVRAANNDGVWNDAGDSITINIPTPFHRTVWFYALMTALLGIVVYAVTKIRERKLKADKNALQEAIEERTKEVDAIKEEILRKDEANRITNWLNGNLKEFVAIANKNKDDVKMLSSATLKFFKDTIGAHIGAVILLNNSDPDDEYLECVLSTGSHSSNGNRRIEKNEGLAGVCFTQRQRMILDKIPENYVKISSGLGMATPKNLLLVPIKIEENTLGVIELSSFSLFEPHHIELVENVMESMASSLYIMKTNQITKDLLERTRQQTEELQAQEEEMRQNMEELEATSESYKRREKELEARIQELMKGKKN